MGLFVLDSAPRETVELQPQKIVWPPIRARWVVWLIYVGVWTWSLERPYPQVVLEHKELAWYLFLFGKTVHVAAYACFAVLSGWLRVPRRYRWILVFVMSLHAWGSEYFQQYTPTRHASLRDVGLDHLGIVLGTLMSMRLWNARD